MLKTVFCTHHDLPPGVSSKYYLRALTVCADHRCAVRVCALVRGGRVLVLVCVLSPGGVIPGESDQ